MNKWWEKTINFRKDPTEVFPPIMNVNNKACANKNIIMEHIVEKLQDITEQKDAIATNFKTKLTHEQINMRDQNRKQISREMKDIMSERVIPDTYCIRQEK